MYWSFPSFSSRTSALFERIVKSNLYWIPSFKLKDEHNIPPGKVHSFPWFQAPYMLAKKFGLNHNTWLQREWAWHAHISFGHYVANNLHETTTLIALSGSGLMQENVQISWWCVCM